MFYPVVDERVGLRGRDEAFVVRSVDYATRSATLAPAESQGPLLEGISFRLLFAPCDSRSSPGAEIPRADTTHEILNGSRTCMHQSRVAIRDMRQAIRSTMAAIHQSQSLISDYDRTIARWHALGCKPNIEAAA